MINWRRGILGGGSRLSEYPFILQGSVGAWLEAGIYEVELDDVMAKCVSCRCCCRPLLGYKVDAGLSDVACYDQRWGTLEIPPGNADHSYLREMCDTDQGKRYDAFVVTSIPKAAVTKVSSFLILRRRY